MSGHTLTSEQYARAEAILEAIVYATDGDDIPDYIELVFLANDDNWVAAHGEADAIASRWALRHYLDRAIPGVEGAPCGHCGQPAWTTNADGLPMHPCCDGLPPDVRCISCRRKGISTVL